MSNHHKPALRSDPQVIPGDSVYDAVAVSDALTALRRELAQIDDLVVAARVLEWDQLVMMPPGGAETRAETLATLHRFAHELFVRDEIGVLLEQLRPETADLDPDSDDACLVAVTRRDWEKARRVPAALRGEMTKHASEGMEAWARARADDDFAGFRPVLDRTLELKRQYVDCFPTPADPYDPLLDDFEPGTRTDEVRRVFDRLEPALRDLVAAAGDDGARAVRRRPVLDGGPARAVTGGGAGVRRHRRVLSPRPDRPPLLHLVRDARRPADDPLRRGRPPRQLDLLDDARGGPRALRARRRPGPRPDASLDGLLVGAARVAEPALGERDRALAAVLALVLPAVPRRVRERARGGPAGALPSGDQPRAAVARARRRRRDDLRPPHHPPLPARAGAALREALHGRPAGGVEHGNGGAARDPPAERPARVPPGRPLVGWDVRVLPDLPARERPLRADLGAAARRPAERVRPGRAGLVRRDLRVAPREPLPARPEVHAGRHDRADRRRADRPGAVPALSRGQERLAGAA